MSSARKFCRAFGKIVCSPCLIVYWLVTGSDKEEEGECLIGEAPGRETIVVEPTSSTNTKNDYGTIEPPKSETPDESGPLPTPTKAENRTTMLWDYSDIFIAQEAAKTKETLAILEESEDEVDIQQEARRIPNTIGSAFVKPDNKDIKEAYKKILKKVPADMLIEEEAVKEVISVPKRIEEEVVVEDKKEPETQKEESQKNTEDKPESSKSTITNPDYKKINWDQPPKKTTKAPDVQSFLNSEKY